MNKGKNPKKICYSIAESCGRLTKRLTACAVVSFTVGIIASLLLDSTERKNAAKFNNKQNK